MIALGSTFLGYLWQDRNSDQIKLAEDAYLDIERRADAAFSPPPSKTSSRPNLSFDPRPGKR